MSNKLQAPLVNIAFTHKHHRHSVSRLSHSIVESPINSSHIVIDDNLGYSTHSDRRMRKKSWPSEHTTEGDGRMYSRWVRMSSNVTQGLTGKVCVSLLFVSNAVGGGKIAFNS